MTLPWGAGARMHRHTPGIRMVDPRGFALGQIAYGRSQADTEPLPQVTRARVSMVDRSVRLWDARQWSRYAQGEVDAWNTKLHASLAGDELLSDSADGGWQVSMFRPAGEVVDEWDARDTHRRCDYDTSCRPVSLWQSDEDDIDRCIERVVYGAPDASATRCAGRLIRHDDEAGCVDIDLHDLTGAVNCSSRRFLSTVDAVDWPASEVMLETEVFVTRVAYDAVGQTSGSVDARGHRQCFRYDVAGRINSVTLPPGGKHPIQVTASLRYDAGDSVIHEVAGNGVVTVATHRVTDGRLTGLSRSAASRVFQDIAYRQTRTCGRSTQPLWRRERMHSAMTLFSLRRHGGRLS